MLLGFDWVYVANTLVHVLADAIKPAKSSCFCFPDLTGFELRTPSFMCSRVGQQAQLLEKQSGQKAV